MADIATPASLPTLASTWTAPTSCFATTNFYRVLLGSKGVFSNVWGTPTPVLSGIPPTGDCFPPNFTINVPYLTQGGCPTGFTRACASAVRPGSDKQAETSMLTCCPSVTDNAVSFMCRDNEYGCHATATEGAVWTGTLTNLMIDTPTEAPITYTPNSQEGLEVWGIKFLSIPSTSTSTEATQESDSQHTLHSHSSSTDLPQALQTNTNGQKDSHGLSTGAVAGIAVGCSIGGILIAAAAFLLYSKRKHRKQRNAPVEQSQQRSGREEKEVPPYVPPYEPQQLDTEERSRVWELQG